VGRGVLVGVDRKGILPQPVKVTAMNKTLIETNKILFFIRLH